MLSRTLFMAPVVYGLLEEATNTDGVSDLVRVVVTLRRWMEFEEKRPECGSSCAKFGDGG